MNKFLIMIACLFAGMKSFAQPENRWQQHVNYKMTIDVDAPKNQFKGKQRLEYSNNSDKTLDKVFYHLYWNAFQPNSSMDVRSRELGKIMVNGRPDWDGRFAIRSLDGIGRLGIHHHVKRFHSGRGSTLGRCRSER